MPRGRRHISAIGFYIAIALIAYGLLGAVFDDLYFPGRRGRGLHLHHEAIPPALLGIILFALTFPLSHFRESIRLSRIRIALNAGAVLSMLVCLYFIVQPTGRRLASIEECQATFEKLEVLVATVSDDRHVRDLLRQRRSECATSPIPKSYHACVDRADRPADVNACHGEAEALFQRRNAS